MSRYVLTKYSLSDLDAIRRYFGPIPDRFALPVLRNLRALLRDIATNPQRGATHSETTRLFGQEVKTRVLPPYRIFYTDARQMQEILAILHTSQDVNIILKKRVQ